MNNRKQQVESFLNTITSKELDEYIKKNRINKDIINKLNKIKKSVETTHIDRITKEINNSFTQVVEKYYKLGAAYVIAFILECFYDKKYKIQDIKYYLKTIIDKDKELKEYVYEIMKDF